MIKKLLGFLVGVALAAILEAGSSEMASVQAQIAEARAKAKIPENFPG